MCNVTHKLFTIGQDVMRQPIWKIHIVQVTYRLLVIGQDVMRFPFRRNVECQSHPVVHRIRCDETMFQKIAECHSHSTAGHRARCNETIFLPESMLFTHFLLVIDKTWWTAFQKIMQCYPLPVDCRTRCDETAFHRMWNVNHFLCILDKCGESAFQEYVGWSLTFCWSY